MKNEVLDALQRSYYALRMRSLTVPLHGDEVLLVPALCELISDATGDTPRVVEAKYTQLIAQNIAPEDVGL